jgi:hypothetical protein
MALLLGTAAPAVAAPGAASPRSASSAAPTTSTPPSLSWTTAAPGTNPGYLAYTAGAYDPDDSTVVVFGGRTASGLASSTTWVWNGSDWQAFNPAGGPAARYLASMAFDPKLDEFILFGGETPGGQLLDDTWAWNGASWTEEASDQPAPPARAGAALALDANGNLVLFGGTGYGPGAGGLSTPSSLATTPTGQVALDDTWTWRGGTAGWVQQNVPGPPARTEAAAAWDPATDQTVLFGGYVPGGLGTSTVLADTWTWNGQAWTLQQPATSPPARYGAVADYAPPAGGPLMTGGAGASGDLSDSWAWVGGDWVPLAQSGPYIARQGAAGGWDSAEGGGTMVVYGGATGGGAYLSSTSLGQLAAPTGPPASTTTTTTRPGGAPPPSPPTTLSTPTTRPTSPAPPTTLSQPPSSPPTTTVARTSPSGSAPPALHTSTTRATPGGSVVLDGFGFAPGAMVRIELHSPPALLTAVRAGPDGRFGVTLDIPAGAAPGRHLLVATGLLPDGRTGSASAPIYLAAESHGVSARTATFLVALALLVPVATYLAMVLGSRWQRRRGRA